jgi:protein-disulfide isomerase
MRLSGKADHPKVSPVAVETRKQQRERVRSERRIAEAKEQARAARRTRLVDLGIAAVLAACTVAALIAISQAGLRDRPAPTPSTELRDELASRFAGIPQHGDTLGNPDAPITMVEFADLQCPFCAQYDRDVLPTLLERYVRAGTVKLVFRPLRFIGPDSARAASAAGAAAAQGTLWQFVDSFYRRQGTENSGYVTDAFLGEIADAIPKLDSARLLAGDDALARRAEREAQLNGIDSTPAFLVGPSGGPLERLEVSSLDPSAFTAQLDALVGSAR